MIIDTKILTLYYQTQVIIKSQVFTQMYASQCEHKGTMDSGDST